MQRNELIIVEGNEGINGGFVHMGDSTQFALVGVEYLIAQKTLPSRHDLVLFVHVCEKHIRLAANELLGCLLIGNVIQLEDEGVATFAAPIEYAEGDKDIVNTENEESGIGIIPVLVAGQALYLAAFAVRAGNATNGYDFFFGNHKGEWVSIFVLFFVVLHIPYKLLPSIPSAGAVGCSYAIALGRFVGVLVRTYNQ